MLSAKKRNMFFPSSFNSHGGVRQGAHGHGKTILILDQHGLLRYPIIMRNVQLLGEAEIKEGIYMTRKNWKKDLDSRYKLRDAASEAVKEVNQAEKSTKLEDTVSEAAKKVNDAAAPTTISAKRRAPSKDEEDEENEKDDDVNNEEDNKGTDDDEKEKNSFDDGENSVKQLPESKTSAPKKTQKELSTKAHSQVRSTFKTSTSTASIVDLDDDLPSNSRPPMPKPLVLKAVKQAKKATSETTKMAKKAIRIASQEVTKTVSKADETDDDMSDLSPTPASVLKSGHKSTMAIMFRCRAHAQANKSNLMAIFQAAKALQKDPSAQNALAVVNNLREVYDEGRRMITEGKKLEKKYGWTDVLWSDMSIEQAVRAADDMMND